MLMLVLLGAGLPRAVVAHL
uniref:Uncharacterized protein n=1 Tax=Anguilla anguilla TaxID=7936 RepID=A0A0E9PX14_ANGAN